MCGFAGFVDSNTINPEEIIHEMLQEIIHRGPDSEGSCSLEGITLGFRRLSIIDISDRASQPMFNEDGTIALIFNGEIYNYIELKEELVLKGHDFKSNTDSEVLVHAYEEYGVELLQMIRGMYAFALWDAKKETLFMARDLVGIKPLYYTQNTTDGSMIFGSEIKTFLKHPNYIKELNKEALKPYLTFQYSVMDETFFKGVYKLKPGHYMLYHKGEYEIKRYWEAKFEEEDNSLLYYVEEIKKTMKESVEAHRISDVKVGSFLSGGIDSSYIAALLQPEHTFTVGFETGDQQFDETDLAAELSEQLKIKNHKKIITADEFFDHLPEIQYLMDEPESNLSAVPLFFLSELAHKYVTVCLSGEGADEIFGGYDWYRKSNKEKVYDCLPEGIRRGLGCLATHFPQNKRTNFYIRGGRNIEDKFIGEAVIFKEKDVARILKKPYMKGPSVKSITAEVYKRVQGKDDLTKMQYLDMNLWLPGDILLKADKMSMAHSIELRVPFLDKKVMELAGKLPSELRMNTHHSKYALREAATEVLPDEWANRKKVGFVVPFKYWMREEKYYLKVKALFDSEEAKIFFDQKLLLNLLEDHYAGRKNEARPIYTVYTFLIWYREYFGQRVSE